MFAIKRFHFECPQCNSRDLEIVRGEELVLESITVEQAENVGPVPTGRCVGSTLPARSSRPSRREGKAK